MVNKIHSQNKLISWMKTLSYIFIIISSYLLYLHYSTSESFCDISPALSCDIVNKSIYSEFPPGSGIPVSFIGILTFILVLIILNNIKSNNVFSIGSYKMNKKSLSNYLFYLMVCGGRYF